MLQHGHEDILYMSLFCHGKHQTKRNKANATVGDDDVLLELNWYALCTQLSQKNWSILDTAVETDYHLEIAVETVACVKNAVEAELADCKKCLGN